MFEHFRTPEAFLAAMLGDVLPEPDLLRDYSAWMRDEGAAISTSVDRAGTPHVQMYDRFGQRVDQIQMAAGYDRLLKRGYQAGVVWRARVQETMLPPFAIGYVTSFYDVGLFCPYTLSIGTFHAVDKFATPATKARFQPRQIAQDDSVWQGATWMTEARGGSDLGAAVETTARHIDGDRWLLTGDKYFCSNAGAELALVAARPEGAPAGVRGLALFLVPRLRDDGSLNVYLRRLKDKIATRSVPTGEVELRESEGYLLGRAEEGLYIILEVLNLSRTANSIGAVALAQRAFADAQSFAEGRQVFGKALIDQPLLRTQATQFAAQIEDAFALAWAAGIIGVYTNREIPGYYSDDFHRFRLLAHLAKFWTAELAIHVSRWAMEVYGGAGTLIENGVERWLREAMILDIWEGPPHRQILDGVEAMARKKAHKLLFAALPEGTADPAVIADLDTRIDALLALPQDERDGSAEPLFRELAITVAGVYGRAYRAVVRT